MRSYGEKWLNANQDLVDSNWQTENTSFEFYDKKAYWDLFLKDKKFTEQEIYEIYNEMNEGEYKYLFTHCCLPPFLIRKISKKLKSLYCIYTHQNISISFIEKYKDKIDTVLMIKENKNLSDTVIKKYYKDFNWKSYEIAKRPYWFIEKYKNYIDWTILSEQISVSKLKPKFINKYKNLLDFKAIISRGEVFKEAIIKSNKEYNLNLSTNSIDYIIAKYTDKKNLSPKEIAKVLDLYEKEIKKEIDDSIKYTESILLEDLDTIWLLTMHTSFYAKDYSGYKEALH